jgi:hypothetical protein
VQAVTEPEPEPGVGPETPEEKRARIMRRLAEMIQGDPPDVSASGPVSSGAFPALPGSADEFDQESAAKLFAALGEFFQRRKTEDSQDLETE